MHVLVCSSGIPKRIRCNCLVKKSVEEEQKMAEEAPEEMKRQVAVQSDEEEPKKHGACKGTGTYLIGKKAGLCREFSRGSSTASCKKTPGCVSYQGENQQSGRAGKLRRY